MGDIIQFPSNAKKLKTAKTCWLEKAVSDLRSLPKPQLVEAAKVLSLLADGFKITWHNEKMLFNREEVQP